MENNLINITNQNGELLVSARELHEALEIKTKFNDWFNRMIQYGFDENIDYIAITQKRVTAQGNETQSRDYILKLDMAKEICMLQRNELGKQFRRYFIECEKQLMVNALPIPQGPTLIGQDPCSNYLIRKNINNLDASDIPRYINQVIEQAKDYKPSERLNTYQLTRKALENLLTNPLESYDIAIVRASLDKLNKLIERQKSYIYGGKLGQAKRKQNELEETIRYYQLDSYDNYYYVDIHGYTTNTAYRAINNEIKCTKSYNDWKDKAEEKMQNLPTLKELGLNPNTHKKIDIYFYLKDPTFDVANCSKSFLDALERHYKKECPTFNDNVFADVRTRKYFSYAGDYDMGFIAFGIKDLTQEEIESLTFDDEE